eukprot:TRINITY_DN33558_c0_g4_i1.p2 TRINITY_DN33558_c0_g4~~TRINITY_DN33558_c0_g4_i1.p2  ORF type:complete len:119 (-),score=2.50 TRINITY_DN33558_c0_g4_i1:218-574(-)
MYQSQTYKTTNPSNPNIYNKMLSVKICKLFLGFVLFSCVASIVYQPGPRCQTTWSGGLTRQQCCQWVDGSGLAQRCCEPIRWGPHLAFQTHLYSRCPPDPDPAPDRCWLPGGCPVGLG